MKRVPLESCPLCGSGPNPILREVDARGHPLWRAPLPFTIPWRECRRTADGMGRPRGCGHVYADPFDEEATALLFERPAHDYQTPSRLKDGSEQRYRAWDLIRRLDYYNVDLFWSMRGPRGDLYRKTRPLRWLDIGAGSGALCRTLQEFGHDVLAVEARMGAIRGLNAVGVPAQHFLAPRDDDFDVVSLGDVLEHVVDMKGLLLRCAENVRKGAGILWISMPNCDSWVLRDMGESDPNWFEIEHLHRPTRKRMTELFAECGLELRAVDVSSYYLGALEYFLKVPRAVQSIDSGEVDGDSPLMWKPPKR